MPDIERGEYLVQAWLELGRVEITPGLGYGALRYAEIVAGQPWVDEAERRVIRRMSEAYCDGLQLGKDALARPPWGDDD